MTNEDNKIDITRTAMLADLNIKCWTGDVTDRQVSEEVTATKQASYDAGRYVKSLMGNHIKPIQKIAGMARQMHYHMTSPWSDSGPRILSMKMYDEYLSTMRPFKAQYFELVNRLCSDDTWYPIVESRRQHLGDMFNEGDFPSPHKARSRFMFDIHFSAVPSSGDFRVEMSEEIVATIKADMDEQHKQGINLAVEKTMERITDVLSSMNQKLLAYEVQAGKKTNVFRDSLVENVRDLSDILPRLNFTNDPRIEEAAHLMKTRLTQHDAHDLRESDSLRTRVALDAKAILNKLNFLNQQQAA